MAGNITPEFKESLLARVDLVELIQARMPLKRAGKDYRACCPFHAENTPSFYVAPDKQFYHCFGCGAHGNAIDFLIEYDRLSFPEAVEALADHAGMALPAAGVPFSSGPDPTPIYNILEQAAAVYREQLRAHPAAPLARDYLKRRGLTGAIAQRYGLGFAPPGWDLLLRRLGTDPGRVATLAAAGLIIEGDGGKRYDRFRERVMFPIHDRRGRVIAFGGRVLGDGEPKYLNSPETPVFHKGRELYGLYQAQQARRRPARLLVVEGYMDVIALAQFGIDYAVATLGTATTPEHIKRLQRSAPELVFCFDGDRAGRAAAWKALETALPQTTGQQPIRFLFLPDGEDPDTLVRKEGSAAFEQRLAGAPLLSAYLLDHLAERFDLVSPEGRSAFRDEADRLLGLVPAGSFRDQLAQAIAHRVPGAAPVGNPAAVAPRRRPAAPRSGLPAAVGKLTSLRLAIALLLDDPALAPLARDCPPDWRETDGPGIALLAELLDIATAYPGITAAQLQERWRDTANQTIIEQLSDSRRLAHIPPEGRGSELTGAIGALNRQALTARRQRRLLGLVRDSGSDNGAGAV